LRRAAFSGKNDDHDAEAIAIAASQPTMRFVAVKSVEAQTILCWHRARQGWIEERRALINRLRGLLAEFGIVIARSADRLRRALPQLIDSASLPAPLQPLLLEAVEQLRAIDARLARCDAEIAAHARADSAAQRLRQVLGVGPLTSSALPASVADARTFRNARQFSAWLGITPTQHSSGGKTRLGRATRRGNAYLRTLLVQGARSTLQAALRTEPAKASHLQRWIVSLHLRKGYHKTLVAIANKHARIAWVLLARGDYDPNAWQRGSRSQRLAAAAT
jgi:transposase